MERDDIPFKQLNYAVLSYLRTFSDGHVVPAEEYAGTNDSGGGSNQTVDPLDIPILESSHGFFLGIDTSRRAIRDISRIFDTVKASVYSAFLELGFDFSEVRLSEPGDYGQLPHEILNRSMLVEIEKEAFGSIFHPAVARRSKEEVAYPRILIFNGFPTQDDGFEKLLRQRLCGQIDRRGFGLDELLRWQCEKYRHVNSALHFFEDPTYTAGQGIDLDNLMRSAVQQTTIELIPAKTQADPWDYRDVMFIIIDYHQDGDNRGSVLTSSPFSAIRIAYESTPVDSCSFI